MDARRRNRRECKDSARPGLEELTKHIYAADLTPGNQAYPDFIRMPDFENLFDRLSPAQVDAILDEQLSGNSSAESRSSETAKYGATNGKSDVDRAFDELMTG
mgnify:CR=1 FL=1